MVVVVVVAVVVVVVVVVGQQSSSTWGEGSGWVGGWMRVKEHYGNVLMR